MQVDRLLGGVDERRDEHAVELLSDEMTAAIATAARCRRRRALDGPEPSQCRASHARVMPELMTWGSRADKNSIHIYRIDGGSNCRVPTET